MFRFPMSLFLCLIVLSFCQTGIGQDSAPLEASNQAKQMAKFLDRSLKKLEFRTLANPQTKIKPDATHTWTNDTRDAYSQGVLAIVSSDGRPIAAVAVYIWNRQLIYEFDLLCRNSIVADRDGRTVWQPTKGVEFRKVSMSQEVEANEKSRLRQMKSISLEFDATMLGWRRDFSDREKLRRMPRELFRYKSEGSKIIDGAVFAYVMGTDPEALLVLEAINEVDTAATAWHYAFVRQTSGGLEGRHQNNVVWDAPQHPPRHDPSQAGFTLTFPFDPATDLAN